ncbi:FAD-dependent oxidoreductase [Planosporangium sp. 12N6]|uniref:FAD-dependent oxidoreductase n=1 Tax=Planosporangium spinosum TaxID=3402278 RepID=UPI003CF55F08
MDVVVAGAGVGGLALARGLRAVPGVAVRVWEQAPEARTGGAAVTIFSNGAAALAGLGAPLGELGGRIDTLRFLTSKGPELMTVDLTVMARRTGFPVATVPRDRLIAHLVAGLPSDTVQYGRQVAAVVPHDQGVTVVDGRGDRHEADVLVGADGHRSAVRHAILDGAPARFCGWTTWQGLTPIVPEVAYGRTGVCVVGPAGLCGLMPAGEGLLQWWFDVPDRVGEPTIAESPVAVLRDRFAGYAGPVPAALDAIKDADIESFPHVLHEVPDRWGSGAATLLGDAAHVFPPSQAQGANQALEDAWLLTRALAAGGREIPAVLRRYEAKRAPRVRRVSRMAARETTNKEVNPLVARAARLVPAGVAGRAHTRLIRSFSSVLTDERI